MFETKLKKYLALCENDPSLLEFSSKRPVVIQYMIQNPDVHFYMAFKDGQVRTGLGQADIPVTLTLTMGVETFIRVMNGEIDGTAAALSGDMKFKGDPIKAMALQKIQKDLSRLWLEVHPDGD